jgi:two-component system OmpR family sensor kinase
MIGLRSPRPTFRARLTSSLVLLSLGVLTAGCGIVYLGVSHTLRSNLDAALVSIAGAEVASSIDGPGGKLHIHEEAPLWLDLAGGAPYEKFARIEDASARIVAQTRNLQAGPELQSDSRRKGKALRGQASIGDISYGAIALRAIYYPIQGPRGDRFVAIIAVPRASLDQSLRTLSGTLWLALLLAGAAAGLGAQRLARRLTQPLERIAQAAVKIGDVNLDHPIPSVSADAELEDVTTVLNEMLARLHAAFAQQQQLILSQQRFIADASHELRSPISNVRGTVEVTLRRPRTADDYRETLESLLPEIERLSRLVNDLLTLSRADAGGLSIAPSRCNLRQVAQSSVSAHQGRAAGRGIILDLNAPEAVCVEADFDRLRQVLDNLLDNAFRYAPNESIISIRVGRDEAQAWISVHDDGPGVPLADQPRVFDRFYRTDESRSRHSGGLGLGLAIARAIMTAHHGSIHLDSRTGSGATFTLTMPLEHATPEPPIHPQLTTATRSS